MCAFSVYLADCHASQIQRRVSQSKADADTEAWRRHGGLEQRRRTGARRPCVDPTVVYQG